MTSFVMLKFVNINTKSSKLNSTIQVIWQSPMVNRIKVNIDGVVRGSPIMVARVSIFRSSKREYIGSFSSILGVQNAIYVGTIGVIHEVEYAQNANFGKLMIECDSSLIYLNSYIPLCCSLETLGKMP